MTSSTSKRSRGFSAGTYKFIFDMAPNPLFTLSSSGEIAGLNPSGARLLQMSHHQLIHLPFDAFVSEDSRPLFAQFRGKVFASKSHETCEIALIPANKQPLLVEISGILLETGIHCLLTLTDMTEFVRKKETTLASEVAIRMSEFKYRTLFETMSQGVIYQDASGKVISANPAAEKMLGLSLAQMTGRKINNPRWHIIREDGTPFPPDTLPVMLALKSRKPNSAVMGVFNPEKNKYSWIEVFAKPEFINDSDTPVHIYTTFNDITNLKELVNQLNTANRTLEERVEKRTRELLEMTSFQQAILDKAALGIITTNSEGVFQSINAAGVKMLGYSSSEIVGKLTPLFFHDKEEALKFTRAATGNNNPPVAEVFQTILQHIENNTTEWTWVKKEGTRFPVKIHHSTLYKPDGSVQAYMALITDITREKQMLDALLESEERFHKMFSEHSAIMFLVDPEDGAIIDANKAAKRFYGYDFDEGIINITEINTLSLAEIRLEMEKAYALQRDYFVFTHQLASGEQRIVEVHSTPIDMGGKHLLFSVIHDITDRRKAEEALKMQSAAFESFALAIIITSAKGKIQWINSGFTKLTGYSAGVAIGKTPGKLLKSGVHDTGFYREFWATLLAKKVWTGEMVNRRKDGSIYYEEQTITPVLDFEGNISSFISIKIDISERKALQQTLNETMAKEKQLNDLKSRFVSMASHEFRTPLTSILLNSETLAAYWDRMDKMMINELLAKIKKQVNHLTSIVTNVLQVSGRQEGKTNIKLAEVDIVALCRGVMQDFLADTSLTDKLFIHSHFERLPMQLDSRLMVQTLNNLFSNAIKYSQPHPFVEVNLYSVNHELHISIMDNGIGIPDADKENIFQPFFRAANVRDIQGNGLGLNIARESVRQHGGELTFYSAAGKGTTFLIRLPLHSATETETASEDLE